MPVVVIRIQDVPYPLIPAIQARHDRSPGAIQ